MSDYDDSMAALDRAADRADLIRQRDHCAKTLKRDAQARQRGENLDGSVRRETVAARNSREEEFG